MATLRNPFKKGTEAALAAPAGPIGPVINPFKETSEPASTPTMPSILPASTPAVISAGRVSVKSPPVPGDFVLRPLGTSSSSIISGNFILRAQDIAILTGSNIWSRLGSSEAGILSASFDSGNTASFPESVRSHIVLPPDMRYGSSLTLKIRYNNRLPRVVPPLFSMIFRLDFLVLSPSTDRDNVDGLYLKPDDLIIRGVRGTNLIDSGSILSIWVPARDNPENEKTGEFIMSSKVLVPGAIIRFIFERRYNFGPSIGGTAANDDESIEPTLNFPSFEFQYEKV